MTRSQLGRKSLQEVMRSNRDKIGLTSSPVAAGFSSSPLSL